MQNPIFDEFDHGCGNLSSDGLENQRSISSKSTTNKRSQAGAFLRTSPARIRSRISGPCRVLWYSPLVLVVRVASFRPRKMFSLATLSISALLGRAFSRNTLAVICGESRPDRRPARFPCTGSSDDTDGPPRRDSSTRRPCASANAPMDSRESPALRHRPRGGSWRRDETAEPTGNSRRSRFCCRK